ncbi:MAG TPA: aspartyl protease family protein [Gemmatimonadaceae bacterium]|nr:aspartyl protease family protein [Gemmatimonadaceae bacterium]
MPVRIPIAVLNNHVFVRVCHGSDTLQFILDTGSGSSLFDLATARRLGVGLGAPIQAQGAGAGSANGALVYGDSVVVPEAGVAVPINAAIPLTAISTAEGRPITGVLGYNFIARFVLAIDYERRELRLYNRDTFQYDGPGMTVPIRLKHNQPQVNADIGLADGGLVHGKFVVDVGSSLALSLTKPLVDVNHLRTRVGHTVMGPGGRGVGGSASAELGRVETLRFGSYVLREPVSHLYGDFAGVFSTGAFWDGDIGGDILRRFTVIFDYGRERMILEPNDSLRAPFETDMSGVRLATDSTFARVVVTNVQPGTPAAEAGLAVADIVTFIDGNAMTAAALPALRSRLRRDHEAVELTVSRHGLDTVIRLKTRRLI